MPDSPDFNKYQPGSVRFSLQDLGELAVRLGSFHIADRRGELIFSDDIRGGLAGWSVAIGGTGASVSVVAGVRLHNKFSILLTGGSTSTKAALISTFIPVTQRSKIGFETALQIGNNLDTITGELDYFSSIVNYTAQFRIDRVNHLLQLLDEFGAWITPYPFSLNSLTSGSICNLKLVFDILTGKYVRLILNGLEVDISAYGMSDPGSSVENTFRILYDARSAGAFNGACYVNHVIVTANEP